MRPKLLFNTNGFLVQIPPSTGALNILYAATPPEVQKGHITGKYITPYGLVDDASDKAGVVASDFNLARELWDRSVELWAKYVDGFEVMEGL